MLSHGVILCVGGLGAFASLAAGADFMFSCQWAESSARGEFPGVLTPFLDVGLVGRR